MLPLVRTVSSSSSLGASLTHHRRRASQSHRLSRRTLSTTPPLPPQDQAFNISSIFFYSVFCIPLISFKIGQIRHCVWLGCPQLPHLAWEFTSEVISVSQPQQLSRKVNYFYLHVRGIHLDILVLLRYVFKSKVGRSVE